MGDPGNGRGEGGRGRSGPSRAAAPDGRVTRSVFPAPPPAHGLRWGRAGAHRPARARRRGHRAGHSGGGSGGMGGRGQVAGPGGMAGPCESATGHLSGLFDVLATSGVDARRYVSIVVVSAPLARSTVHTCLVTKPRISRTAVTWLLDVGRRMHQVAKLGSRPSFADRRRTKVGGGGCTPSRSGLTSNATQRSAVAGELSVLVARIWRSSLKPSSDLRSCLASALSMLPCTTRSPRVTS
jgi:hypothetical protein